jgi:imidazolonepropionase
MPDWDSLWINARLAPMVASSADWDEVDDGALAVADGRIAWVGAVDRLPEVPADCRIHDVGGRWITPGLIDCHTHLVFAGDRSREFEQRLQGAGYAEIAAAGGGIIATMRATRDASRGALIDSALSRIGGLMAEGVTTVEIKSGYGLDTPSEIRCLEVGRRLGDLLPIDIVTTFLGAHSVPPEYVGDADAYVGVICGEMLPAVAERGLADAVDAYCETLAFSPAQVRRVFDRARELGLPVKLHADQFSDGGGAALAAEYRALSADHLEYASDAGVEAMAEAGTTAVLLPGAFYTLRETRPPPIAALRRAAVPLALATDLNPGSSPVYSILAILNLGCVLFGLTPQEALTGVTRHAAAALGLSDRGTLETGKRADLAIWDIDHPRELCARLGVNPCIDTVAAGTSCRAGGPGPINRSSD